VARLFISHSGANNAAAIALCEWLTEQGFDDVFLDVDPERGLVAGQRWQEALKAAADRCEAVLFLISPAWLGSKWCLAEFLLAKTLHKRIFGLIVEPVPLDRVPVEMTAEWQLCQLVGDDPLRKYDVPIGSKHETIAFREAGLDLLRRGLQRAGLDAKSFLWPPPSDLKRAPYRGLRALEAEDAAIFFGRDAAIVRGLDHIRGLAEGGIEKFFVVLGASGSGKSSFLRAGLWPRLTRDDLNFLSLPVIRPQAAVMTGSSGLIASLAAAFEKLGQARSPGRIKEALGKSGEFGKLLKELSDLAQRRLVGFETEQHLTTILSVDQAEELYSADGAAEAATFLQMLGEMLSPNSAHRVLALATIRSDRFELLQAEPSLRQVKQHLFNLPPIAPAEFKAVIEGPALRVAEAGGQLAIDAALTERLMVDAQGADALPLLAFTLERLYADYGSEGKLTVAEYEKLGGVQGSIEEAIGGALSEPGRSPQIPVAKGDQLAQLRAAFIPWLARIDPDTNAPMRRLARIDELPQGTVSIVQRLVEARLLVVDHRSGADVLEIAHESLLRQWPALGAWLQADADDLKAVDAVERATREWMRNGCQDAWLDHREERLLFAERVASRGDFRRRFGDHELAYLEACRNHETADLQQKKSAHARDRQRKIAQALVGSLAVVLIAAFLAWNFQLPLQNEFYRIRHTTALAIDTEKALSAKATFSECDDCPEMVVIPSGTFSMGSNDIAHHRDEYPQHEVAISQPFAVSQTELTFDQWDACARFGGCRAGISGGSWNRGKQPVINVTWKDANDYVQWLSNVSGKQYRLLTEAEWEYAASAKKTTLFFFGDDDALLGRYGWYTLNAENKAHLVGQKEANPFGLKDMYGNVSEWVEDCYHDGYGGAPGDSWPWLSGDCSHRVVRGGDWQSRASSLRSTFRDWFYYDQSRDTTGIRVGRTLAR
jgi:formylglycine-generating enzyme required for sulfatase activity